MNVRWRCVGADDAEAAVIKLVSRGTVSHVEFIIGDDGLHTLGARADGGVAIRPINYAVFQIDLRFQTECSQDQYDKLTAFLGAQLGKPYNYIDLLAILANRDWRNTSSWICSELWAAALEASGLIGKLDASINLFTPEEALIVSSAMFTATPTPLQGAL